MTIAIIAATALGSGLAAFALTRWMRELARTESYWLRCGLHIVLAFGAGIGAALLATGWAELVGYALLGVGCALLTVIDLAAMLLPNLIVGPLYLVTFAALTVAALSSGQPERLGRAALAAALSSGTYLALALISPSGIGLGDVKLAGVLGGFLGWQGWWNALLGTLAAFLLSGLVAIILLISTRANRRTAFPFGPLMIAGAAIGAASAPALAPF